jgi:hypothetical protein
MAPIEPTSAEGDMTISEACEAIQQAADAASVLTQAMTGFFCVASATADAASAVPATVPRGLSASRMMPATSGSAAARDTCAAMPASEEPNQLPRGVSGPETDTMAILLGCVGTLSRGRGRFLARYRAG